MLKRIIQLINLLPHRLNIGLQLRDEIVPELIIGLLFRINNLLNIIGKPDIRKRMQLSAVFIIVLTFNIEGHDIVPVIGRPQSPAV